jgi:hypothetical protein
VKCPKCQFENPAGVKLRVECGGKLEFVCPNCGFTNSPAFRFSGDCGHDLRSPEKAHTDDYSQPHTYTPKFLAEKILTARSSIEGERKLVTVPSGWALGLSTRRGPCWIFASLTPPYRSKKPFIGLIGLQKELCRKPGETGQGSVALHLLQWRVYLATS